MLAVVYGKRLVERALVCWSFLVKASFCSILGLGKLFGSSQWHGFVVCGRTWATRSDAPLAPRSEPGHR